MTDVQRQQCQRMFCEWYARNDRAAGAMLHDSLMEYDYPWKKDLQYLLFPDRDASILLPLEEPWEKVYMRLVHWLWEGLLPWSRMTRDCRCR